MTRSKEILKVAREHSCGFREMGVLLYLDSLEDKTCESNDIHQVSSDGIAAVRTSVKKLRDRGLVIMNGQEHKNGRFGKSYYKLNI